MRPDLPLALAFLLAGVSVHAQVNILTANGNNERTNANLQEFQLTPATVTPANFGKIGSYQVDGQLYAQPLYVSGVSIPGAGTRNLLIVASMHNSVYAFDADAMPQVNNPAPLWHINLGTPVPSSLLFGPYGDIANETGILSTGAIDLARGVVYMVSDTLRQGAPVFTLHALDLATGAESLNGPVVIAASSGGVAFNALQHLQRPGLLLANGSVYLSFGSHGDQAPWHGWLIAYDAGDLTRQSGVFLATPTGNGGSIWQSGRGPAADSAGSLYVMTGNGDYDGEYTGGQNLSQSFLRLSRNPSVSGWYTPPDWRVLSDNDFDLSAGPALVPGTHILLGGDKAGNLYAIDGDQLTNGSAPQTSAASSFAASTGSIFNMAVWTQPDGALVYVQGSADSLKCFRISGTAFNRTPVSSATTPQQYSRVGMTLSAYAANLQTGILWETSGNYNDSSKPGTLHAFQASDLSVELWNSDMNPARDMMGAVAKFSNPTVANGRVYVSTFAGRVDVYGLFAEGIQSPTIVTSVANAASYQQDAVSPGELVAIFGSNLGPPTATGLTLDSSGIVSTRLAQTRVLFDGIPVPLIYVSDTQVNAIVPFGLTADSTQVSVEYQGLSSDSLTLAVAPATPGIFSADGSGAGAGVIVNQDGTINSTQYPAPPGSVVTLYATGAGLMSPLGPDGSVVAADALPQASSPVTAIVGGVAAEILYAGGSPGLVQGVLQVNLRIPDAVPSGDAVTLVLRAAGRDSQSGITVAIGAPPGLP